MAYLTATLVVLRLRPGKGPRRPAGRALQWPSIGRGPGSDGALLQLLHAGIEHPLFGLPILMAASWAR